MIVSMWMTREIVTIDPHTPLAQAAALMTRHRIRRLPVVERHKNSVFPVGIVTATDILHACPPDINPFAVTSAANARIHMTAGEIMSRSPRMIPPDTPIEDAARIMRDAKISTLLVIQKMKLMGLITESDIFRAFVGILESTSAGARLTFTRAEGEDIFSLVAPIALKSGVQILSLMTMEQAQQKYCVIRIAGGAMEDMINELWKSGHTVLNVLRY